MAIKVIGATCSLGEAVIDKLLMMDVNVIAKEENHLNRNASLLDYSTADIVREGSGFSISFDDSDADIVVGKDLIVHDLLPSRADKWLAPEIINWANGDDIAGPSRYWLGVIDAANAIAHILKAEVRLDNVHMCGRREWSSEDTKSEFDMLWRRTNQGISGNFTAEVLFGHEIAGMEAKPIADEVNQRPDLDPLHQLLLGLTGDGWRPLMPLRTALMTLIAGLQEPV